jgi:hypothetical protein
MGRDMLTRPTYCPCQRLLTAAESLIRLSTPSDERPIPIGLSRFSNCKYY